MTSEAPSYPAANPKLGGELPSAEATPADSIGKQAASKNEPASQPSQALELVDRTYRKTIRSVRLTPKDRPLDPPIIGLGTGESLELLFDELANDTRPYRVVVRHCDRNWVPSDLEPYEYVDGFDRLTINDYAFSSLGQTRFVHYRLTFPSPDFILTKSGQYLLVVYDDDASDLPVISRRFYVVDGSASVEGEVVRPAAPTQRNSHQQVRFQVQTSNLNNANPLEQLGVTVLQNMRWDNAMQKLQPQFVRDGTMIYERPDQVFPAGKEWRYFSLRSLRFLTERVASVNRETSPPSVRLMPDDVRSFRNYRYRADMNGAWFIAVDDTERDELEADYVTAQFFLRYPAPLTDGDIHLFGGFTDYRLTPETAMEYDFDRGGYAAEWLLKQGVYNMQYAFVPTGSTSVDLTVAEGDWYEAENRYDVLVHYQDFRERYDRLIGHVALRSVR